MGRARRTRARCARRRGGQGLRRHQRRRGAVGNQPLAGAAGRRVARRGDRGQGGRRSWADRSTVDRADARHRRRASGVPARLGVRRALAAGHPDPTLLRAVARLSPFPSRARPQGGRHAARPQSRPRAARVLLRCGGRGGWCPATGRPALARHGGRGGAGHGRDDLEEPLAGWRRQHRRRTPDGDGGRGAAVEHGDVELLRHRPDGHVHGQEPRPGRGVVLDRGRDADHLRQPGRQQARAALAPRCAARSSPGSTSSRPPGARGRGRRRRTSTW